VAVNPDKELLAEARENGWQVLRFDRLGWRLKSVVGSLRRPPQVESSSAPLATAR
jgi:hypothetical protein